MSGTNLPPSAEPPRPEPAASVPPEPALERVVIKIFMGSNGIRAGWRLTIFLIIVVALLAGVTLTTLGLNHGKVPAQPAGQLSPRFAFGNEVIPFLIVLFAAFVMSKLEGRRIADYGLPWRRAVLGKFWQGIAIGFVSITALLFAMHLAGVFQFGTIGLHGAVLWEYGVLWAFVFLFVGFFEEFLFRGYPLFTLTTGMTFWPSAVVLSAVFGLIHHSNPGESWIGAFNAGAVGFLLCVIVRRTGDLWMPIGFHAAWDWGETYFYGVADSGLLAQGHLFNSSSSGAVWLSGGTVGPEGSYLCLVLIAILCLIFALWMREKKFPDPAAIRPHRGRQAAESLSLNL
jgi:uncharacterized protein